MTAAAGTRPVPTPRPGAWARFCAGLSQERVFRMIPFILVEGMFILVVIIPFLLTIYIGFALARESPVRAVDVPGSGHYVAVLTNEALDLLEAKRDELFVAPAIGLLYSRVNEAESFGITREVAVKLGAVGGLERSQRLYPEMRKRGIRVLPGGDYGFPYNPIGRNARDLQLFVELLGFSPIEALVAATKSGGELMGRGDLLGQVKPGYLADLLVVNGDPTRDVRVLQDHSLLTIIMKDGAFHKRAAALRDSQFALT